jgi:thioredoxin-related protein
MWRSLFLVFLLLLGCETHSESMSKARVAQAVGAAEASVGVHVWEGQLPLHGKTVEETTPVEPASVSFEDPIGAECDEAPLSEAPVEVATDRIRWLKWSKKNLQLAKQAGKPVLLHVTSDNCYHCDRMHKGTFRDPKVILVVNRDFTPIRINATKDRPDKSWRIKVYPTDVLVSSGSLKEIARASGYASAPEYLNRLANFHFAHDKSSAKLSYPARRHWWTGCGSWKHLAYSSSHRGKFDKTWLEYLPWNQLQSLHADDHESRVKWAYVVRHQT